MKATDYEVHSSIQADVLGYLHEHPNAADSVDGIRQWWLMKQLARRTPARVQQALEELVAAGLIEAREMDDGRRVYACTGENKNESRQPGLPATNNHTA